MYYLSITQQQISLASNAAYSEPRKMAAVLLQYELTSHVTNHLLFQ